MKLPFERWEPTRDPIHRFIHVFDLTAVMVACHRWRPLLPDPPRPAPSARCAPPPADPDAHPPEIEAAERLSALADAAVAAFARLGRPADDTEIGTGVHLIAEFSEAYRRHPCPCLVCPDCGGRPQPQPCEFLMAVLYAPTRQTVLHQLALGGQAVPLFIRMRGARVAQLLRAEDPPPAPHPALRRALAEVLSSCHPPRGQRKWTTAGLRRWVDHLAGPVGTEVGAAWTLRRTSECRPDGTEVYQGSGQANGQLIVGPPVAVSAAAGPAADQPPPVGPPVAIRRRLRAAELAILTTLAEADRPLKGATVARRAGYQPGSLRRHFVPLRTAGLIDHTNEGYRLTATGRAVVTDLSRSHDRSHTEPVPGAGPEE